MYRRDTGRMLPFPLHCHQYCQEDGLLYQSVVHIHKGFCSCHHNPKWHPPSQPGASSYCGEDGVRAMCPFDFHWVHGYSLAPRAPGQTDAILSLCLYHHGLPPFGFTSISKLLPAPDLSFSVFCVHTVHPHLAYRSTALLFLS